MSDGFVETPKHGRIHYLEAGEGLAIILVHSNGNSAQTFHDMLPNLGQRYRVLAIDLPGQGDSEPLRRHYSVGDYAEAIIAFMDCLGLKTASVLGSSIGGAIAVDLGVRFPTRLEKLFVVEAPTRTPEEWRTGWARTEKQFGVVIQTEEQVGPRLRHLTPALLERWNVDRSKAGAWTMVDVMWALRDYDIISAIPQITANVMAIYGDKSPNPRALELFANALPQARRAQIKDCGHFPMLDDPAELAYLVDSFISDAPTGA